MLAPPQLTLLDKAPTGIAGLDEITGGGLPRGRTTLVCGGAGCGKTMMGLQFLVRGALDHGEPGVLMAFEETVGALKQNVASLGWDLDDLIERKLLVIDEVRLPPSEVIEAGAWDLDALMLRLNIAIEAVGATRVVLDTVEVLFGALSDERLLRMELRRLFAWLNDRGVSAIVTGERGDGTMTRHGLEEYVSDCVILLDQRLVQQTATRRLRITKYRGSAHGADEYPFLIDDTGFSVLPLTSLGLAHVISDERVSVGLPELDQMLAGGIYRGSTVLVTGMPGSGKTTLGGLFASAACARGERVVMFTFEESPEQVIRNEKSVGIDLAPWREQGLLRIVATRPGAFGLERHLAVKHKNIVDFDPQHVIIDPVSALTGERYEVEAMLARLIDFLKARGVTAFLTALIRQRDDGAMLEISSVVDTWIELTNHEYNGERTHGISIVKSRGTAHSSQLREFQLSSDGLVLREPYARGGEILMGTARQAMESQDQMATMVEDGRVATKRRALERRRALHEAEIAALRESIASEQDDFEQEAAGTLARDTRRDVDQADLVSARGGKTTGADGNGHHGGSP